MASQLKQKPYLLFLLGFVLINAYVPGIVGASISTGWLFLLIVIPISLFFCEIRITTIHLIGFVFLLYAALSLTWTTNFNIGFFVFLQLVILGCVFCLASGLDDIKPIIVGLAAGLIVSDLISIAQSNHYYNLVFALPFSIAGLFVNKNIFCEVSVIILICLLVFKLYWWIPVTLPGTLLVHSRGAMVGLFVGLLFWIAKKNKTAAWVLGISAVVCGAVYYLGSNSLSIFERFYLWADAARGLTFFGSGIGSFEILYPLNAVYIDTSIARPKYAHNDLLHYVFELGIGSLLFIAVVVNVLRLKSDAKIILYTVGTISMFAYPLHIPAAAFIAFLVAGFISRNHAPIQSYGTIRGSSLFKGYEGRRANIF